LIGISFMSVCFSILAISLLALNLMRKIHILKVEDTQP
jgi:hypothetical protein